MFGLFVHPKPIGSRRPVVEMSVPGAKRDAIEVGHVLMVAARTSSSVTLSGSETSRAFSQDVAVMRDTDAGVAPRSHFPTSPRSKPEQVELTSEGVMTFWQALKATYGGGFAFLVACPLLALVPVVFELVQHVVEVHIGMYDSIALAKATADDPLRLGFGLVKIASLTVPLYWINRFLAFRDPSFASTISASACRRFSPFVFVQLAVAALSLFVLPQTVWLAIAGLILTQIVACLLMAWGVAAPLDNGQVGPRVSAAIMWRQLPWTFVFTWVAVLPLLIPHYAFAFFAIGAHGSLWPILIVDSLLVGCLTAVIAASGFFAAMRAATKKGVSLMPPRENSRFIQLRNRSYARRDGWRSPVSVNSLLKAKP